jgi:predicted PurR-regulated permease PerM
VSRRGETIRGPVIAGKAFVPDKACLRETRMEMAASGSGTDGLPTETDATPAAGPLARIESVLRWTAGGALALLALWQLADVAMLVFAAILLAVVLRGAAMGVSRMIGLAPGWSLALVCVTLLAVLGGLGWWAGPRLAGQIQELWGQLTAQARQAGDAMQSTRWGPMVVERARAYASGAGERIAGAATGFATTTLGALGSTVVVLATALYFAAAPGMYRDGTLSLLPRRYRPRWRSRLDAMAEALWWWFIGQGMDMIVVGVLTFAGLSLLGVKLALPLALIAALLNFVPYVGAIAGAVPAVLVALAQGPEMVGWTALLFLVVQTLEGNVIAPLIQRSTVDLPPAVTILSQTVLGTLLGPAGLVLATPLAVAGLVLTKDLLEARDEAAAQTV